MGPDGSFWLGSKDNADSRPNLVLNANATTGTVISEIELPAELETNTRKNGIEGIAVSGNPEEEQIYVAIQRAWPVTGDTDEVNTNFSIGWYLT